MDTGTRLLLVGAGAGLLYAGTRMLSHPEEAAKVRESLAPGWNTIVFLGETRPIKGAFAGLESKINDVWWWDEEEEVWRAYSPTAPDWANDLLFLLIGETYWIHAAVSCEWSYTIDA